MRRRRDSVPETVGVPEISPVLGLIERPAGSVPTTDHVNVKPSGFVAVGTSENGTPKLMLSSLMLLIVGAVNAVREPRMRSGNCNAFCARPPVTMTFDA